MTNRVNCAARTIENFGRMQRRENHKWYGTSNDVVSSYLKEATGNVRRTLRAVETSSDDASFQFTTSNHTSTLPMRRGRPNPSTDCAKREKSKLTPSDSSFELDVAIRTTTVVSVIMALSISKQHRFSTPVVSSY